MQIPTGFPPGHPRRGCQKNFLWHSLRMKLSWAVLLLSLVLLLSAHAQLEADEKYISISSLAQQGDNLVATDPRTALTAWGDAQAQLRRFQKMYPDWNPGLISYRLEDVTKKIAGLQGESAATNAPPTKIETAGAPAETTDQIRAQLDNLNAQVRAAQSENETLQAKLKEALAAQPATIDATELTRAQEQLRSLMKENDLLKAGRPSAREKVVVTDTNAVAKVQRELNDYVKKYAEQRARAEQLMAENERLRQSQKTGGVDTEALAILRRQNEKLKALVAGDTNELAQTRQQLADFVQKLSAEHAQVEQLTAENAKLQKNSEQNVAALGALREQNQKLQAKLAAVPATPAGSLEAEKLSAQLREARAEIAALKSAAAVAALEKTTLENKVGQLSAELADLRAANFEARLRDLAEQRDDLLKKLSAANKLNASRRGAGAEAQLAALNAEVKTLRDRIAVDEAKAVPFAREELALFKQAAPQLPVAAKKVIHNLPAGAAELVASAQEHFARHEFDAAEADYQKILDRDQNNGLILANLATIELQQDKLADAEKHITAAVAQSPDDAYNLSTLGYLKFRQEKYDEALDVLSRAAAIDPKNPEIQNYLGVTLSHKGQRMQAETALRKAIALNPLYAPAHNNLAVVYLTQKPSSPLLARWHYQKAVTAGQPRNPDLEKMLADEGAPMVP